jgi:hypothetical protein
MDWDYSYFIPKNNAFSKQWAKPEAETEGISILIVTEVNRCLPCAECGKQIGEKATTYFEIDKKQYCTKCGSKRATAKIKTQIPQAK